MCKDRYYVTGCAKQTQMIKPVYTAVIYDTGLCSIHIVNPK